MIRDGSSRAEILSRSRAIIDRERGQPSGGQAAEPAWDSTISSRCVAEAEAIFKAADQNGDGVMSRTELRKYLRSNNEVLQRLIEERYDAEALQWIAAQPEVCEWLDVVRDTSSALRPSTIRQW